jgi:RHS repeat-associated protein
MSTVKARAFWLSALFLLASSLRAQPPLENLSPADGSVIGSRTGVLTGRASGATLLRIDGTEVALGAGGAFSHSFELAEGAGALTLYAEDAGGNTSQVHHLVVDTLAPAIVVTAPAQSRLSSSPALIAGTVQEAHLAGVTVRGSPAELSGGSFSASVTLAEGAQNVAVVATDSLGHTSTVTLALTLDTQAPTIAVTENGVPFAGGIFARTVTPQIFFGDAGPLSTEILLDGAAYTSGTPISGAGAHRLEISATDAVGWTTTREIDFSLDFTAPTFGAISPAAGTLVATATVSLQVEAAGATSVRVGSLVGSASGNVFTIGPISLSEGQNTLQIEAFDAAGNRAERAHTLIRDTTAPTLSVESPAHGSTVTASPVSVAGQASDPRLASVKVNGNPASLAGGSFAASASLAEGANSLLVEAFDAAGNRAAQTIELTLDSSAPTFEVKVNGVALQGGETFAGAIAPTLSLGDPAATVNATLDGAAFTFGATISSSGSHQLSVTVSHNGLSSSNLFVFTIDSDPPTFLAVLPAAGTITAAASVTLEGRVANAVGLTIDGTPVELVGEVWSSAPLALAEGPRTFNLRAVAESGLFAERQLTITRDSTQPTLAVTAPAAGALISAATVDVSGSAGDLHLESVLAGGVAAQLSGSSFLARGVPLAEGDNPLQVVARDRAGNEKTLSRSVVRDSTVPVLTIGDPAAGTVVPAASYTVRGSATDAHLDRVEVNGRRATLAGSAWQLEVPLVEGDNNLEVVAIDRLGQRATGGVVLRRDSAAPQVLIQQPAEGFATQQAEILVRGVVEIEEGATVKVNGEEAAVVDGHFEALVALSPGENRLVARATDAQGNQGVHSRVVFRDQTAPSFVRVEPASGALSLPLAASFRLTFSEELAPPAEGAIALATASGTPLAFAAAVLGSELVLTPQAALPPQTLVRLTLTGQLRDRAGNALAPVPAPFEWTTVDTGAPSAPTVSPAPPAAVCATSLVLAGQAEGLAQVRAEGGAAAALARAGEDGAFSIVVELLPEQLNLLRLTASDALGNVSPQLQLEVAADCTPPRVLSAGLAGAVVTVTFSENVAAAAAAFSLDSAAGSESFAFAAAGAGATLTLATPPAGLLALTVDATVADLAGNTMVYPWQRLFGAGAGDSFLAGAAFDDATGQPLAGVVAAVTATGGVALAAPLPQTTTGEDGRFLLGLPAGTHDLTFARPGYAPVFRVVTTVAGEGAHVFAPRLTPLRPATSLGAAGGEVTDGPARLALPAGALAAATQVSLTRLGEQALPALLPYGWSPRGAAWIELGASVASPATLTLPAETASGRAVVIASLDLGLLQWRALVLATVSGATLEIEIEAPGAYVVLEADAEAALVPVLGQVLPSLPAPSGEPIASAAVDFSPSLVLPSQRSLATVTYGLAGTELPPSGTPLSLSVQERLTLLDGSERRTVPYQADLLVYRDPGGEPRSLFYLRPSALAASLPIELGVDQVTLRTFGELSVRGNVLGPDGGSVLGEDGDLFEVPAGALAGPTAVTVVRRTAGDLPLAPPAGFVVLGVVQIELGGQELDAAGRLTLSTEEPPAAGAEGLLLGGAEVDGQLRWRALAALEPVAGGWRTAAAGGANPPWPGVRQGGVYLAIELQGEWARHEGQLYDADQDLIAGGVITSSAVPWLQLSLAEGRFVLPLPAGEDDLVVAARDQRRDRVAVLLPELEDDQRYQLDLELLPTGPTVVELTPADGAANVPVTFLPTVTFSESVDRATLAAGVRLLLEGEPVAVELDHQDEQVRVEPLAPLRPDTSYQLEVNGAVRDLQGRQLAGAFSATFRTTAAPPLPPGIDGTKVKLYEPDSQGLAKVVGLPGAVPAGSLMWIESVETITVTAPADGSFELEIPAEVGDTLYLSVLMPGQSSAVHALRPWLLRQGSGAWIGPEGGRFTSEIGLEVIAAPGTFPFPARVTVAPVAAPIGHHASFTTLLDFQLDLGGAVAKKPLELRLPAPAGAPSGSTYLLNRYMEALGRRGWMVMDLLERSGNTLTNGAVGASGASTLELRAGDAEVPALRFEVPSERVLEAGEILELRAGELNPRAARPLPASSQVAATSLLAAKNLDSAPQASMAPISLPGPRIGGNYQLAYTGMNLAFVSIPGASGVLGVSVFDAAPPFLARVLVELEEPNPRLYLPALAETGMETEIQLLDLDTGYTLYDEILPAPTEPVLVIPPSDFSDHQPPVVIAGAPFRFLVIHTATEGTWELGAGITVEVAGSTVTVRGGEATAKPDAQVRLFGLDNAQDEDSRAGANGAFTLSASILGDGDRLLLAIGGRIGPSERVELLLSEAVESLEGIDLYPSDESGATTSPVDSLKTAKEEGTLWSLVPRTGWRAGFYQLQISPEFKDANGNAWPRPFTIEFEVPASSSVSSIPNGIFSDFDRLGNILGVLAQTDGLRLWDVSDPANPEPFLAENESYRFAGGGAMRGLAAEDHGRFVLVGSGEQFAGQLHVVDPLVMDRTSWDLEQVWEDGVFGFTSIANGANQTQPFPIKGLPREVATLNLDQSAIWRWGDEAPPADLEITELENEATGEFTLTITGETLRPHVPVSVRNLSRGTWRRVYADADSQFEIEIKATEGEALYIARGIATFAYTTVDGFGIAALDIEDTRGGVLGDMESLSLVGYTRGYNVGQAAPCGPRRFDIDRTPIDLALLHGDSGVSLVTLVKGYGLGIFSIDGDDPRELYELSAACGAVDEQVSLNGLAVADDYPIDLDGDGRIREQDEIAANGATLPKEARDYAVVTHAQGWLLLFDLTDPAQPQLVGKVKVGQLGVVGSATGPVVDLENRRIYVSGFGSGVYAIDFNSTLGLEEIDADHDGFDDRVVEKIQVGAAEMMGIVAMPDLGMIWAAGRRDTVAGISVAGPSLQIVSADSGPAREVVQLAPFGVPTEAEAEGSPYQLPAVFQVLAKVASTLPELTIDVVSITPGGEEIDPAGSEEGLPATGFKEDDALVLSRQAENPWEEGYNLFTSEKVVSIADLRAAIGYERSEAEDEACLRCDQVGEGVYPEPPGPGDYLHELLAGDRVRVRFSADALPSLKQVYGDRLGEGETVASVPWAISPAVMQEAPAVDGSATPPIAPGVFCPSGEFVTSETDAAVGGGGSEFAFTRSYRSATLGAGSLGPGWDHNYNIKLRELPDGDVQLFDGSGRVDRFAARGDGSYEPAQGRFETLVKTSEGFTLTDPDRNLFRFDSFGRMVSFADALATGDGSGNESRLSYDASSRLTNVTDPTGRDFSFKYDDDGRLEQLKDFDGRAWDYGYDPQGQLTSVKAPSADLGGSSAQVEKSYSYSPGGGNDLRGRLNQLGQLGSIKKPDGQSFLDLQWIDNDGDGIPEEMVSQAAGPGNLAVQIDRETRIATVTDRRDFVSYYTLNAACQPTRYVDPTGAVWTYAYNNRGQMTSMVEPLGRVSSFEYEGPNLIKETVLPDERGTGGAPAELVTRYAYEGTSTRPTTITDAAGTVTAIVRDPAGQPLSVTTAAGTADAVTETYKYNELGQVTEHVDTSGVKTVYRYDDRGYPLSEEIDPGGAGVLTRFETNERGQVTAVIDDLGRRTEIEYNAIGWKTAMRQAAAGIGEDAPPLGYVTRWIYDLNGNVRELRIPFGDGTTYTRQRTTYGLFNEVLKVATEQMPDTPDDQWVVETKAYDANLNLVATEDAVGHRQQIHYDGRNMPIRILRGLSEDEPPAEPIEENFVYDGERQLVTWIDGRGKSWTQAYDGYGRLARQTDPLGNFETTEYDALGQATGSKQFDAAEVLLAQGSTLYDRLGRRKSITRQLWNPAIEDDPPRPITTQFTYDGASRVRMVIDPKGRIQERLYDSAGRLAEAKDSAGNRQTFAYDATGQVAAVTRHEASAGGVVAVPTSFSYDAAGRLSRETDALGNVTRYAYDARHQLVETIDPEGHFTRSEFDGLGLQVRETRPEGIEVLFAYDGAGRLIEYRDAKNQVTTYEYDLLGRQTRVGYPDGFSEEFAYDEAGNLIEQKDQLGTTVHHSFDDANRRISAQAQAGPGSEVLGPFTESFEWDGAGRLLSAQSGGIVTERSYDSLGRTIAEKVDGREIRYQLDDAGNAETTTFDSGYQVARTFDGLDRVSQVLGNQQLAGSFEYRGQNALEKAVLGNGLIRRTSFDALTRPLVSTVRKGELLAPVLAERLAWTPRGMKAAVERGDRNDFGDVFAYDGAGRLVGVAAKGKALEGIANNSVPSPNLLAGAPDAEDFLYDTARNLLRRGVRENGESSVVDLPADSSGRNRPASVGGAILEWDANGNLRRKDGQRFFYDWHNRLRQIADAGSGALIATYQYDAFDRRIGKTVGSQSVEYLWDGWHLVEEIGPGDLVLARRIPGLSFDDYLRFEVNLDGVGAPEATYIPVYDSAGNLVVITDHAGKPIERYEYDAFGLRRIFVDTVPPEILQVRKEGTTLLLELSEEVSLTSLEEAASRGDITLTAGQSVGLAFAQPVQDGPLARRRLAITTSAVIPNGATVQLRLAANVFSDSFLNRSPAAELIFEFPWSTQGVIDDFAPPQVERVGLRAGKVEIDFTERVDLAAATAAVEIDGAGVVWTLDASGYRLVASAALAAGEHAIEIASMAIDLDGQGLAQVFNQTLTVAAEEYDLVFQASDPREVAASTVANPFGFQGLPIDAETGLIYVRNRFYDPELGTFISADPLGYADGPSMYAFAGSNPVNLRDPLGLESMGEAVQRYAVDAYAGDNIGKKGLAFLMQLGYATVEFASVGAVGKIDKAQEALDRGQITKEEYWKQTGTAVAQAAASTLAGGVAGRLAGKAGCHLASKLNLGAAGQRLLSAGAGAVGAGASTLASDLVGIATGTQDSLSSGKQYLMSMGIGGIFSLASRLPCHCFTAGTTIATEGGEKPIEAIEIGDTVWAFNQATGQNEPARVVSLFRKEAGSLLVLQVRGEELEVTPQHPIYVPGRGWVEAGNLEIGDQLLGLDGELITVEEIGWREGFIEVYNFEVEGLHNYFAGQIEVLVHNCLRTEILRKGKWRSAIQNVKGPGIRQHFGKHRSQVDASSLKEYNAAARRVIERGREFRYRDKASNKPRVGYWDPETDGFVAVDMRNKIPKILTYFPQTRDQIQRLPGITFSRR